MASHASRARERTVWFLSTPALWPCWPFLPVVRRSRGTEELGVVFDAHAAQLMGYSATVFLVNMFALPRSFESFMALPKEVYDSAEELADNGWLVD